MQKKRSQVYSEEFKKEKVKLLESGEVRMCDLKRMYGVSYPTMIRWKKKYGLLPVTDRVVMEKDSEYKKNAELCRKIAKMEQLIGRQQMELDYYKEVVRQATTHFEMDIEKKFSTK